MEPEEFKRSIELIKEKTGSYEIKISRMPKDAYRDFKAIADKEFSSDYGMCLLFLVRYYQGLLPTGLEAIQVEIQSLKYEIEELKKRVPQDEKKAKTNMLGQKIGVE